MSGRTLRRMLLPAMALLLALTLTVTAAMESRASELDISLGRGAEMVDSLDGVPAREASYYPQAYSNAQAARDAAFQVSNRISDEGIVLLKNDGLLPLSVGTVLSPFGLRYTHPYYGGVGSSAIDASQSYIVSPHQGLHDAGFLLNAALEERLLTGDEETDPTQDSRVVATYPVDGDAANALYEFDTALYADTELSCRRTVGLVFVGRQTGEERDASVSPYTDGTPHMLALTVAEKNTLAFAKANCDAVVVVLESSAPMELAVLHDDAGVSAILWMGSAGSSGFGSLGRILSGAVVPSGRLPDIYPVDFRRDPTFANFDDGSDRFVYLNATTTLVGHTTWEENAATPFREYEEGVYLGYKYYETAHDIGALSDYYNRTDGVLYPFGYGLSYADFSQEILSFSDEGERIDLTIRVTNTGTRYAGREVVQVYVTPPYSDLDRRYGIEKPTVVLVRFAKTRPIAPGQHEDITLSFDKGEMASYCAARDNGDGTRGCYVLTAGRYDITLRANSHEVLDRRESVLSTTVWYDNTRPRASETDAQSALSDAGESLGYPAGRGVGVGSFVAATNQFEQLDTYMTDNTVGGATILSRRDWAGTQPTAPTDDDRQASDTVVAWIGASDTTKPDDGRESNWSVVPRLDNATDPVGDLVLTDLRGKSYYDPMWERMLAQIDESNLRQVRRVLLEGAYQTNAIAAIGKPQSRERDGPQGLTQPDQSGRNWLSDTCAYPSAPVMAATWNAQLLYELLEVSMSGMVVVGWSQPT